MTDEERRERKPQTKLILLITTIVIIIIVAGTVFYVVGKAKFTPAKKITAFEDAVTNKDTKELKDLLHPYKDSFEITEDNTATLIGYLNDHPDALKQIKNRLNEQVESLQSSKDSGSSDDLFGTINLSQAGKRWLLFDDFHFEVVPAMIQVNTKNPDVDLLINDDKVATTSKAYEESSFGPFMPGAYKVKAAFDNTYASVADEEEIELFNNEQQTVSHSFELPLEEIEIKSRYDEFNLYVNDKKTDIKVDGGKQSIGTFPFDGSVELDIRKEYPWGEVKSDKETVDENYINFNSINVLSEEDEVALMEQINDTVNQYNEALTKNDTSLIKDGVTDNMKKNFKKEIKEIKKKRPNYKSNLVRATYRMDEKHPDYNENLDGYTITFKALYTTHVPSGKGFFGWQSRDEDKKEYTSASNVIVLYDEDEKEWKIDEMEDDYFIITSNEEKVFEYAKDKKKEEKK
ncbi:putative membrane protein YvbJ [Virgibacillus halotolerans]|uniref:zinc ribbon domain-containing protein n=1 Tax=Virgibacillus halotolerans TaxID=1071053 RepID=UPI001960DFA0|nr:hypothetical protein [Virgibacillus halotolerans]MBM7597867.1 putative membrane protein YvbJ [Virgibacillus halotolerans]